MTSRNWKQNLKLYRPQRPVKQWIVEVAYHAWKKQNHIVDVPTAHDQSLISNGQSVKEECNIVQYKVDQLWISGISRMGSIKDIKFLLKSRILNLSTQAAPDKKATGAEDAEWLGLVWAFLGVFCQVGFPRNSSMLNP